MYATREEFIQKFQETHPPSNTETTRYIRKPFKKKKSSYTTSSCPKRYDRLYNMAKEKREKIAAKKKKKDIEESTKQLNECTFTPVISTRQNCSIINTKQINESLYNRQLYWENKRNNKINKLSKAQQQKILNECLFSPVIRNDDEIKWEIFEGKTENLVADPESYEMYIQRRNDKRQKDIQIKKEALLKPGNGNVWKNRYLLPRSYSKKTFHTIDNSKNKVLKRNYSYDKIRTISDNKGKLNKGQHSKQMMYFEGNKNNNNNNNNNDEEYIDYYNAIRCLHQELNSLKLME